MLIIVPQANCQVAVSLAPVSRQQFFSPTGTPLANGCVFTYASGTSTPQAAYSDVSGLFQLSNPIILDAGGFATIYLSNTSYRIVVFSSGGTNCATGNQQWVADGVSAYQIISGISNLTFAGVTVDPSGTPGEIGYRSDIPCLRIYTGIWDCAVELTLTQTLTNKTLITPAITTPVITVGGSWAGSPSLTNPVLNGVNGQTGTSYTFLASDEQKLVTVNNSSPIAVSLPQATTIGFGAGTVFHIRNQGTSLVTITPTISQIDGAATLQLFGGQGADIYSDGANYQTQKGSAPAAGGAAVGCTNFTPVTIANLNTQQNLFSCTIPANALIQGSLLNVDITGIESTASSQSITIGVSVGGGTPCTSLISTGVANNQPFNFSGKFAVLTTGAGGTANWSCELFGPGAAIAGPFGVVGAPTISVNTTISNVLQVTVQMSVANAGNTTTGQLLKAVIY